MLPATQSQTLNDYVRGWTAIFVWKLVSYNMKLLAGGVISNKDVHMWLNQHSCVIITSFSTRMGFSSQLLQNMECHVVALTPEGLVVWLGPVLCVIKTAVNKAASSCTSPWELGLVDQILWMLTRTQEEPRSKAFVFLLMFLCGFHIMHSDPPYLPFPSNLPSVLVISPLKQS